jgi:flagellar protein FlaG
MTFQIGQLILQSAGSAPAAPARARFEPSTLRAPAPADEADVIPASPPPEVLAVVDAAWDRAAELAAANRELHFSRDNLTGRTIIEVRTLDGEVLRTISPSRLLDVIGGGAL